MKKYINFVYLYIFIFNIFIKLVLRPLFSIKCFTIKLPNIIKSLPQKSLFQIYPEYRGNFSNGTSFPNAF